MPIQPSTLYAIQVQQQPFTLTSERDAWHITFPGHASELDVHGSRIEAQAIARCYHSLFLAPGAPFAYAELSECEMLDMAEREAAIEIEVQQRRLQALLYAPAGDGALASVRVQEPPAPYQAAALVPRACLPWSRKRIRTGRSGSRSTLETGTAFHQVHGMAPTTAVAA